MASVGVAELRQILRHLQSWRVLFLEEGLEMLPGPNGDISLWDVERLLEKGLPLLTVRQRQAIQVCLVHDMAESEAAVRMGLKDTNPVLMYATDGLKKLVYLMDEGVLPDLGGF